MTEIVDRLLREGEAKEQIDRIADNSDYIATRFAHFMFAHSNISEHHQTIVREFVAWCIAEDQKDLDAPRGRDGKSYRERAQEESQGASGNDIDLILAESGKLFDLKARLAKLTVLGPWKEAAGGWERPEAGRHESDVGVWKADESTSLEVGWHFRLGFGVVGIAGVSSRKPSVTAEECMARVDELLARVESIVIT